MTSSSRELGEVRAVLPAARVEGRLEGRRVRGVTADSRSVRRDWVFVCLKGARSDGHAFVPKAVRDGAVAVVAEHPLRCTAPVFVVRDTRRALAALAAWVWDYPSRGLDVVGITGTSGKTTTAYMLESVLKEAGRRPALFGTVTYRFGARTWPSDHTTAQAPELQSIFAGVRRAGADSVVMEVSSHALDQHRVEGVAFRVGAFTNLSREHLDYHRTMSAYREAKTRLFDGLPGAALGGVAVVNLDDSAGRWVAARTAARVLGVSRRGRAGAFLEASAVRATARATTFVLGEGSRRLPVRLRLLGDYNVDNALVAAGAARGLGIGMGVIRTGLERLARVPGRFEPVRLGAPFTVVVDYAHKPDALDRVLAAARGLRPRKLLCVFGCGGNRDRGKRPVMGRIATSRADFTWITSDNPRDEAPAGIIREIAKGALRRGRHAVEPDRKRAISAALAAARPGDLVVIAGKGHERYQLVRGVRRPFDDALVARAAWGLLRGRGASG
ncbi:MAG: UDP-N-acetylmuramoyl-L-alanyl-D-glutamate--2,6-diaminopimelate ligase [Candidatus Coatesbacteria bacterium]